MKRLLPYLLGGLIGLLIAGLGVFLLRCWIVGFKTIEMDCTANGSDDEVWQDRHPEALIPGYSDFMAQRYYLDFYIAIFSYRCPQEMTSEEVFATLKEQIPDFSPSEEAPTALFLKGPRSRQWRFLFHEETKTLTAMNSYGTPPERWIGFHKEAHNEYRQRGVHPR